MRTTRQILAEKAMEESVYRLKRGENTEVSKGALIHAYGSALSSWQDIEGVFLKRTPKPVKTEETYRANPSVKKMFVMANLVNEEGHCFDNMIILN
jgi:hypothetical protein